VIRPPPNRAYSQTTPANRPVTRKRAIMDEPVRQRFWRKVDQSGDCWLWTGGTSPSGYGRFRLEGRNEYAHRVSYLMAFGDIPQGMEIDHVKDRGCTNKACVRPQHLEAVPHKINCYRAEGVGTRNARKTHCKRGHPLCGANLYLAPNGSRQCRTCARDRQTTRYGLKQAAG